MYPSPFRSVSTGLIDSDRLRATFEQYSVIGSTDRDGLHWPAFSEADCRVRDRFVDGLEERGLWVRVDEIGNVFGRRPGTEDLEPNLIGSPLAPP